MKIFLGKQTPEHKGDTSRELVDMWEESNLCEVIRGEVDDVFIWANEPNDVLLYEYDRYDVYPGLPRECNKALFAGMQHEYGRAWIYWGRHPRKLESKISEGIKTYEERNIESIFLGKVENKVQQHHRTKHDWSKVIELFKMPMKLGDSFNWPYSQDEYLDKLANSKFGLCMAGYGPKCNREIEVMGLGVVPLMINNVCTIYHNPIKEGEHFLRVDSPEHAREVINNCDKDQWKYISDNARNWYEENCSREGSFKVTQEIVNLKVW
tara:strand:- start:208 stop:1005 length:798 start_codon:yes stop_codon:yes gene_type:complete